MIGKLKKITVVYVIVSSETDYFLEELYLSTYSLKRYNDCQCVVLMDDKTYKTLDTKRKGMLEYVDDIQVVDFQQNISPKERSRILKTSFRNRLEGWLLFLDTDTIVCKSLDILENNEKELSMVLEGNDFLSNFYSVNGLEKTLKKYDLKMGINDLYFNSGVILVKDTEKTRYFFSQWEKLYKKFYDLGLTFDQATLNHLNYLLDGYISKLSNEFNCQGDLGLSCLSDAYIIHYLGLNTNIHEGQLFFSFSKFADKQLYNKIKKTGKIDKNTKLMIETPNKQIKKGFFISNDTLLYTLLFSKQFKVLRYMISKKKALYTIIENILSVFLK